MRLLVLAIVAIFRPKVLLIAENFCLRQQLIVLQRRHPRPRLRDADRRFWILASRWFTDWRHPLLIVKPESTQGLYDFDPVGHYSRPDVFKLTVDTRAKLAVDFGIAMVP